MRKSHFELWFNKNIFITGINKISCLPAYCIAGEQLILCLLFEIAINSYPDSSQTAIFLAMLLCSYTADK